MYVIQNRSNNIENLNLKKKKTVSLKRIYRVDGRHIIIVMNEIQKRLINNGKF